MLDCKQVSRLLSQAQDTTLPWGIRLQLRLHLFICAACTHFDQHLRLLREAMHRYRE